MKIATTLGVLMNRSVFQFLGIMTLAFNLISCAEVTSKNYGSRKSGTVKYSEGCMTGDKNRAKALELADEFCRPARATIVSENNRSEFTGHTTSTQHRSGNIVTGESNQTKEKNIYIHFVCQSQTAARR